MKLLPLLLLLLLPSVGLAQFTFITNADNTITVTGYTGTNAEVVIPATTNGYPVVSIGDSAFAGTFSQPNPSLTNITIPNSVTKIGRGVFYHYTSLPTVVLPNSITQIGDMAFSNCSNLTDIVIPNGVAILGYQLFYGCSGLTNLIIGSSVTNIGSWLFVGCPNASIAAKASAARKRQAW
jgi:hypothetical protein